VASAVAVASLVVVYTVTLAAGLLTLDSPQDPIGDPYFSLLEVLILSMVPFMVTLMVAVHAWAPAEARVFSLTALAFMVVLAGLTSALHFVTLTVSREAAFADLSWLPLLLSFEWPSVAYAIDILAWDVFFALSVLFAASVFGGSRLALWVRALLIVSGVLRRHGWGTPVSAAAGMLWMGWFVVQVAVVGFVSWQQPVYFVVGVLILALAAPSLAGWLRLRSRPQSNRAFR
jgi:hypothetical protein